MKYYQFCTKNWRENAKNLVFGILGKFLARFLAGFGSGDYGGRRRGKRRDFSCQKWFRECQKQIVGCQKFCFWQIRDIFGRIFGNLRKFLADYRCKNSWKAYKLGICEDIQESAKNLVFGSQKQIFGILGKFLADYRCKIFEKPINRGFVKDFEKCQKFQIWQKGRCFWQITFVRLLESL